MSPAVSGGEALIAPTARIHPTAIVETGARIGARTAVWDSVHVRAGAVIGSDCIIGEKSYVAGDAFIGNFVKINAMVYIPTGVTVEDGVMISAGTIFTNDRYPRALRRDLSGLETSAATEETLTTRVCRGATIGAGGTIGPGLTIGAFAMVGMGAIVTRDVPPHALVIGQPATIVAFVCHCGPRIIALDDLDDAEAGTTWPCERCGRRFGRKRGQFVLVDDPYGRGVIDP
jgi:acetyltransferase-like isoleucine patch superfamily enzyme